MRRFLWFGIVILAMILVACIETSHDDIEDDSLNPDVVDGDEGGDFGNSITLYLSVDVTDSEFEELTAALAESDPGAEVELIVSDRDFTITPGRSQELSACLLWDGPYVEVNGDPQGGTAQSIVEAVEPLDFVVLVDAPQLGIGLEVVGDTGENTIERCDSRRVTVWLDPAEELDLDALRESAIEIPGVLGSSSTAAQEPLFTPDLSSYPDVQACYPPSLLDLTIYLEEADADLGAGVVSLFQDIVGIAGFSGPGIDPELDPISRWEVEVFEGDEGFYEENCLAVEVYVELDGNITDEEAAVVVARAKGIEGVADVDLRLTEFVSGDDCEAGDHRILGVVFDVPADMVDPCFTASSQMTIYRGDAALATAQVICEALCQIPGVLGIHGEGRDFQEDGRRGVGLAERCETFLEDPPPPPEHLVIPQDVEGPIAEGVARSSGGSPAPDVLGSVPCDEGKPPLPLGTVSDVPEGIRLDFLFELCWEGCFRDAHFVDPDDPDMGSGRFTAGAPFHIRHGFPSISDDALGPGFDVVVYVTPIDEDYVEQGEGESPSRSENVTYRYTSDYVVRGSSGSCGPTYGMQEEPVSCEWFVHEFDEGLPAGRHAIWAVWEAPCSAWVDYGFTNSCDDPDEVVSLFSSGVDSPFEFSPPRYDEPRGSGF